MIVTGQSGVTSASSQESCTQIVGVDAYSDVYTNSYTLTGSPQGGGATVSSQS